MYNIVKLREVFPETTVCKDNEIVNLFKTVKIESFLRDWILKRKAGPDGKIHDIEELSRYIASVIPHRNDKERLEEEARSEGTTKPFLSKINIAFNSNTGEHCFEIPDLGFTYSTTIIEDYVWDRIKDDLLDEAGGWGLIKIGYRPPEPNRRNGKFTLNEYKRFRPYEVNLEAFCEARAKYSDTEEWMNILLGAIDYDGDQFRSPEMTEEDAWLAKHTMLTRVLPFVQPRLNLMELAPQQTGKSYIFGKIGKYGCLVGGKVSRTRMFLDQRAGAKSKGLVTYCDFIAIDELKSFKFTDDKEMSGHLKNYMEQGYVNINGTKVEGDAGIIFLGNIDVNDMKPGMDMFKDLPDVFRDSALIQRIHGFVPGRYIHPIDPKMIIDGWALNTEYFSEIMHLMRSTAETMRYRSYVDKLVTVYSNGEISNREKEAVFNLCTAYLKLFFPHVNDELINDYNFKVDFQKYCLSPAINMQSTVLQQLKIINPNEFKNKNMATYAIRE